MVDMASKRHPLLYERLRQGSLPGDYLLTVSEAADLLSAHPNSVRRWSDSGLLPAYRVGPRRDRRFKFDDVSLFLVPNGPYVIGMGSNHS